MRKTIVTMSTVAVVGLTSALFVDTAHAEKSVTQIQDQRSEIKEDLFDAEQEIADLLLDLEEINEEIANVDDALEENKKQVNKTKDTIADKETKVDELQDEIKELEEKIEKRYDIMKERIVAYQKSGGDVKYLEVLFDASSFSDFINRTSAVSTISDADNDLIKQQEKDKSTVESKQEEVQGKLDELEDEKAEKEAIQDTITEQKEQNENRKEKLETKEADLEDMKADLETEDSDLADLEAEVRKNMEEVKSDNSKQEVSTPASNKDDESTNSSSKANDSTATKTTTKTVSSSSSDQSKSKKKPDKDTGSKAKAFAVTSNKSSGGGSAITAGEKYIGNSTYVFGGGRTQSDINKGHFDCSGFVSWAYSQEGKSLPASTDGLAGVGKKVSYSNIQPGDLVFFDTYKKNGHVGIYIGGGQFIGSQDSTGVAKVSMSNPYWSGVFNGNVRRVK